MAGGGSGRVLDVREVPDGRRGRWGVGAIHHLAWRVDDSAHELEMRARIDQAGRNPTPVIDRFWFKSVYFLEPGGVLFELATDGPGFSVDEDPQHLGESLVLPPWLESQRQQSRPPFLRSAIRPPLSRHRDDVWMSGASTRGQRSPELKLRPTDVQPVRPTGLAYRFNARRS